MLVPIIEMVCFSRFVYNVKFEDLVTFLENIKRYFPNTDWTVTLHKRIVFQSGGPLAYRSHQDMVKRLVELNLVVGDVLTFDTGRIWDQKSFVHALPIVDFGAVKITEKDSIPYANIAQIMARNYHDSGRESASFHEIDFPWEEAYKVMKAVNDIMPLDGFFCSLTSKTLWMKKKGSSRIMVIRRHTDGLDWYTNSSPHILFDFDDGFILGTNDGVGDRSVPMELQKAFETWVRQGRKGPVLSLSLPSLQSMCADTCRQGGLTVPNVLNL